MAGGLSTDHKSRGSPGLASPWRPQEDPRTRGRVDSSLGELFPFLTAVFPPPPEAWVEKPSFGKPLEEHLTISGREIAFPIEACVTMLLECGMQEEVGVSSAQLVPTEPVSLVSSPGKPHVGYCSLWHSPFLQVLLCP